MRYYTVHLPEGEIGSGDAVLGQAVFVREGFNWLAFFFAPFWAIAEGLWLTSLPLLGGLAVIIVLPTVFGLDPIWPVMLGLGYGVLAGTSGNDWRRAGLDMRGYRLVEVVAAPDRAQAVIRYAEAGGGALAPSAPAAAAAHPPAPGRSEGGLGLGPSPGFWS
jgi:hypothetical protein